MGKTPDGLRTSATPAIPSPQGGGDRRRRASPSSSVAPTMKILAIDTAANLCAACVFDGEADRELGRSVRDIGMGHAEVLMDVIAEALAAAGAGFADLG